MKPDRDAMWQFDLAQREGTVRFVIGVDEAGRGALAGPVFAAAVVLRSADGLDGVDDSKSLTPLERERLAEAIKQSAAAWAVAQVSPREIDRHGIDWANRVVFTRAVRQIQAQLPECTRRTALVLVDGVRPAYRCPLAQRLVTGGDRLSLSIAAASILAKTARDRYCVEVMERRYPEYGFARHKGYGTAAHYAALERFGPSPLHRTSYTLRRSG